MSESRVLVTGGSRGIGRAVVEQLAAAGWSTAFTWFSSEEGARLTEAACGGRAVAFQADVRDSQSVTLAVRAVEERLGPLDALVNNAGIGHGALLAMTSDEEWRQVMETNTGGAFRACRAVLPGMMRRRRGVIVNVSSLGALHGVAGQGIYAASKAGLLGLTRALAREVGPRNVRVNAVIPGFVDTDMTAGLPEGVKARLRAAECLPSGTTAGAVADAVAFLLSDAARAITGQCLVVDAGASA